MPLRQLYESPTVEGLAAVIEALQRGELTTLPPLVRVERGGALPPSFTQERMWFLDQLLPGDTAYNMPSPVVLHRPQNLTALEQSLGEVIRRHDTLRTRFVNTDGRPVQIIAAPTQLRIGIIDLSALPSNQRQTQLRRLAGVESQRPFDLSVGPSCGFPSFILMRTIRSSC